MLYIGVFVGFLNLKNSFKMMYNDIHGGLCSLKHVDFLGGNDIVDKCCDVIVICCLTIRVYSNMLFDNPCI